MSRVDGSRAGHSIAGLSAFLSMSLLLALPHPARARTWHVNPAGTGDAPTIQSAMLAASAGDTVELACGTYNEHGITLTSGVCLRSATGQYACATIDGGYQGIILTGTNLDATTRLEGITVKHGGLLIPGPLAIGSIGPGLQLTNASPVIARCRFVSNVGYLEGGGIAASGGGAIVLNDCLVDSNSCYGHDNPNAGQGGGIYCSGTALTMTRVTVRDNWSGSSGGGVYSDYPASTVTDCVFSRNHTRGQGNAFTGYGAITGSTFSHNDNGSGGLWLTAATNVSNTIIAFGTAVTCTGSTALSCCDVYGNTGGDWVSCLAGQESVRGNFSADPVFCNPDSNQLTLDAESPCLPGRDPVGPDCGLIGALPAGCAASTGVAAGAAGGSPGGRDGAAAFSLAPCAPDPFGAGTLVRYAIPAAAPVSLRIYDAAGRAVRTLSRGAESAGTHALFWDGRDDRGHAAPGGVYFCVLSASGRMESTRVVRLR